MSVHIWPLISFIAAPEVLGSMEATTIVTRGALALSSQGAAVSPGDIRIELRRGATAMSIHWPVQSSAECAAWLREWLK